MASFVGRTLKNLCLSSPTSRPYSPTVRVVHIMNLIKFSKRLLVLPWVFWWACWEFVKAFPPRLWRKLIRIRIISCGFGEYLSWKPVGLRTRPRRMYSLIITLCSGQVIPFESFFYFLCKAGFLRAFFLSSCWFCLLCCKKKNSVVFTVCFSGNVLMLPWPARRVILRLLSSAVVPEPPFTAPQDCLCLYSEPRAARGHNLFTLTIYREGEIY